MRNVIRRTFASLLLCLAALALFACSGESASPSDTAVASTTEAVQPPTETVVMNVGKPCSFDPSVAFTKFLEDDWDWNNTPNAPEHYLLYRGAATNGVSEGWYSSSVGKDVVWYTTDQTIFSALSTACAATDSATNTQVTLTWKVQGTKSTPKALIAPYLAITYTSPHH